MPKNIVVCCDDVVGGSASNIVRLYVTLKRDPSQVAFYYPGLAMQAASYSARTPMGFARRLLDISFGIGLFEELKTTYRFLMDTYEPGDRLFFLAPAAEATRSACWRGFSTSPVSSTVATKR